MHLNMVERDEDDDGNGGAGNITDDQVKTLDTLIQDAKADKAAFLSKIAYVSQLEDIPAKDFGRCLNALKEKARAVK